MFDNLTIRCNYSSNGFTQWDYIDDVDDVGFIGIGGFQGGEAMPTVEVVID